MSVISDFREMSVEQLQAELKASQKELFDLRFRATTEKLDSPSNLKKLRRNIARIKTISRERELAAAAKAAASTAKN